jgi:hypothetical protein
MRKRRVLSVACPAVQLNSTLYHKRKDNRKKNTKQKYVFWLSVQICPKHFSF